MKPQVFSSSSHSLAYFNANKLPVPHGTQLLRLLMPVPFRFQMYWLVGHVVRRPATSQLKSWCIGKRYNSVIRRIQTDYRPPQQTEYRPLAKTSKPLRILFCGSDDFSSASLRGLYEEQRRDPELIASIDVLCRPGKPSGRSLKNIRQGTSPRYQLFRDQSDLR
jgi:hypothetical protein